MSATATKTLNIARSQIGYVEGQNKHTKYGMWYGMDHQNWCDMFISWVAVAAGARDIIGRCAYTPSHAAWFQAIDRWGHTPARGAIVFYDWPDAQDRIQHIGIVESVRRDGRIVTIEGNTSSGAGGSQGAGGGVYRRVRSTSCVAGYGYPAYSSERNTTPMDRKNADRSTRPPLIIDAQWGRNTTRAVQRWVGVADDGVIGPHTRKGLQAHVGVAPDGSWGPITHQALQRAVGVRTDGVWGPVTIRALQRKLNADWRR